MMSTLICSLCGEVRVETTRSVVLPFVCTGCQPDMSGGQYLAPEEEQLQDETATTLATVELISDLESQLAAAKELSQGQTELIEQLETLNTVLSDRVDELTKLSTKKDDLLLMLNNAAFEEAQRADLLFKIAHVLAFHYGFVTGKVQHLETENGQLKRAIILYRDLSVE